MTFGGSPMLRGAASGAATSRSLSGVCRAPARRGADGNCLRAGDMPAGSPLKVAPQEITRYQPHSSPAGPVQPAGETSPVLLVDLARLAATPAGAALR